MCTHTHTPHNNTVVQDVCRDNPLSRMGLAAVRALARSPAWHARFELVLWNMMAGILHEQHFSTRVVLVGDSGGVLVVVAVVDTGMMSGVCCGCYDTCTRMHIHAYGSTDTPCTSSHPCLTHDPLPLPHTQPLPHTEHRYQQNGTLPTVEEWWPVRRSGAGGLFGAALVEHALDMELPESVVADSRVQRMIELSGRLCCFVMMWVRVGELLVVCVEMLVLVGIMCFSIHEHNQPCMRSFLTCIHQCHQPLGISLALLSHPCFFSHLYPCSHTLAGELVMLGNDLTSLANNIKENRPMMNYVLLLKYVCEGVESCNSGVVAYGALCCKVCGRCFITAFAHRMLHCLPLEVAVEITMAKFQAAVAEFDTLAAAVEAGAGDAGYATMLRDYASGLRAMVAGTVMVGSNAMRYKQYQVLDTTQRAVRVEVEWV